MTQENEKILESCKRYIDAGLYNKNVALQYKRLTGLDMSCTKTGLLGYNKLVLDHIYGVMWYLFVGTICIAFANGIEVDFLKWFDGLVVVLVSMGLFLEITPLVSKYMLDYYYINREILDISKCKEWQLDVLLGKGVVKVEVEDNQLILESCERYIEKGIKNKYVNEYYKKLKGETLTETTEKHLLSVKSIILNCLKQLCFSMLFAFFVDIVCTMFQVYEFLDIRLYLVVGIIFLYTSLRCIYLYLVKARKVKSLGSFHYSYVDYIVGRGYAKVEKEGIEDEQK